MRMEGLLNTVRDLADPGSWQIAAPVAGDFANIFLYARAKIANAIGKPWILEETGMEVRACQVLWSAVKRLAAAYHYWLLAARFTV